MGRETWEGMGMEERDRMGKDSKVGGRNDRSRKGWEGRKWEGTNVIRKGREELTRNGKIGMVSERWEGWEEKGC